MKPKALVDPHPERWICCLVLEPLQAAGSRRGLTVWGRRTGPSAEMVDKHPAEARWCREQLESRACRSVATLINVEGNFQPNIDYEYCLQRGIHVLGAGVAFGKAAAETSLGMALALARGIGGRLPSGREVIGRLSQQSLLSGAEVGFVGFGNLAGR